MFCKPYQYFFKILYNNEVADQKRNMLLICNFF